MRCGNNLSSVLLTTLHLLHHTIGLAYHTISYRMTNFTKISSENMSWFWTGASIPLKPMMHIAHSPISAKCINPPIFVLFFASPYFYASCLTRTGYFEALDLTWPPRNLTWTKRLAVAGLIGIALVDKLNSLTLLSVALRNFEGLNNTFTCTSEKSRWKMLYWCITDARTHTRTCTVAGNFQ